MKGILLFILLSKTVYAGVCSQLEQEIIVLENQIQKSKLPQCDTNNNVFCCRPDEPDSCLRHNEVEARYNDAMAKLVIYEGLLALGETIEDNHKIIQNMNQKNLEGARNTVTDFFDALNKAELINNSLELNGDDGLWTDYSGNEVSDMEEYLNIVCAGQQYQQFCSSYQRITQDSPDKKFEYLESIHGFAVADRHVLDNNKRRDYQQYQDYLKVSIDGEDVNYNQLASHPQVAKLKQLKEKVLELENNRTPNKAAEILALSKELNDVEVSFNEGIDVKSRFKEFISSDVEKGIASLNQSTQLLLGSSDYKNNLDKILNSFTKQQSSHKSVLTNEIRELIGNSPDLSCNSGENEVSCLVRLCDPMSLEEDCNNRSSAALSDLYRSKKKIDKLQETKDMIESTKVCLAQESLDAQEQCVLAMKEDLFEIAHDKVEDLRKELAHIEKVRHNMNRGQPFADIQKEKALVMMSFKNLGCFNEENIVQVNEMQSSCNIPKIDNFAQTSLSLKSDVDEVMINLSMQPHLDREHNLDKNKFLAYREDYIDLCNKSERSGFLCTYFQEAQDRDDRTQELIDKGAYSFDNMHALAYNQAGVGAISDKDYKDPNAFGLEEAVVATAYTGAQLLPGFIQLGYMKQNHEQRMNAGVNHLNNLYRQRDYYNWYSSNYQNINLQNYGWNYYDGYRPTSFNGGNTQGLYYSPTDYSQVSFASPMLMSPNTFDFSSTGASQSTNVTTVGFGF